MTIPLGFVHILAFRIVGGTSRNPESRQITGHKCDPHHFQWHPNRNAILPHDELRSNHANRVAGHMSPKEVQELLLGDRRPKIVCVILQ